MRAFFAAGVVCFALTPSAVFAQVVITEIMYDLPSGSDAGREWIEVFNAGAMPVQLGTYKLFENDTNHTITAASSDDALYPGAYAVIADNPAKFKADFPAYAGELFDSAFSLSNTGETLELRDASSTRVDAVSYTSSMGASGDGNSLNRGPGSSILVPRAPSPGRPMSSFALASPPKSSPESPKTAPKTGASSLRFSQPSLPEASPHEASSSSLIIKDTGGESETYLWWFAAAAIAAIGGSSVYFARRFSKNEWDIVEESGENV